MVPHLNAVLIAPTSKNNLSALLRQLQQHSPEISILGTANSIEKGRNLLDIHQPNLVFVEVCAPFCESFEILKQLEPIDFEMIIVNNCTGCSFHHTHFVKGSYINNPRNAAELKAGITHSQSNILHKTQVQPPQPTTPTLTKTVAISLKVTIKGIHQKIAFEDILYLSAHGNYTHIYMNDETIHMECKILKLLEELLPMNMFCRIDRGIIANKKHIVLFTNATKSSVTMSNEAVLRVSKRKKANFISFYQRA